MKKYFIDVGANDGNDTQSMIVNNDPDCHTFAFEPNPVLHRRILDRFAGQKCWCIDSAVSDYNGKAKFHISDLGDAGTSSLFEFDAKLLQTPLRMYEWYEQGFQREIEVKVTRLDTFLDEIANIDNEGPRVKMSDVNPDFEITYLHIDAQGSDFAVLRGLGEYISRVKEGKCEATYQIPIYQNNDNRYEDIEKFLLDHGFEVTREYIHQHNSEVDLRFRRR